MPFSFTFLWLSKKIITCCPCSTDIFSGFGFGRGRKAEIDVVFSVSPPSRGKKLPLLQMPENANIAKKKPPTTVFCSFCLAFAFILSTEYAWPFCSVALSSTQIIDHVLTTTVEHVQRCPLLWWQTQPNSQILASVLLPIFWNLTYEMHFGLVCV